MTTASIRSLTDIDYLYYYAGNVDKNGVHTLDEKNAAGCEGFQSIPPSKVRILKFPIREKNVSVHDNSYVQLLLDTQEIADSKAAQLLNRSQKYCTGFNMAYYSGLYALLGFTLKALVSDPYKQAFAPSITYMIQNSPSLITFKNRPEQYRPYFYDRDIEKTCNSYDPVDYLPFALLSVDVTSSECFPNTEIPGSTSRCINGDKVNVKLKGYTFGTFNNLSSTDVKELIIRFGSVQTGGVVLVGWKDTKWIAADRDWDENKYFGTELELDVSAYGGRVVFYPSLANVAMIVGIVCGVVAALIIIILVIIYCYCTRCMCCQCCNCCSCFRKKSSYNDTESFNKNNAISDFPEGGQQMSDITKPPIYASQPQQPTSYPAIPSSYEVQPSQQPTQYPSSYAASVGE
ncbi:MAG: hypothetical protein EZS28_008372 [Streblomastix strix]|uniref:Uncharacterized protein n=1 Tax=Streblomastix strix TaxID=222440 RepID=A0A5J4WMS6_9EUKA|nr:MAG: hypothetical protein EZS28_008372 [Streblomastix strix]